MHARRFIVAILLAAVLGGSQIAEERVPMATVRAGDPPVPKPPAVIVHVPLTPAEPVQRVKYETRTLCGFAMMLQQREEERRRNGA
jgi:hypothetical protein